MPATKTLKKAAPRAPHSAPTIARAVVQDGEIVVVEEQKPAKKPRRPPGSAKIAPAKGIVPYKKCHFDISLMREICSRVGRGEALYRICQESGMPDRSTFFGKIAADLEYNRMWVAAREARAEFFADELTELSDAALNDSAENIQARKLQVNTRQWLASRFLPKVYGDKVTHSGDAENPIVTQLVMGANDLLTKIKGPK